MYLNHLHQLTINKHKENPDECQSSTIILAMATKLAVAIPTTIKQLVYLTITLRREQSCAQSREYKLRYQCHVMVIPPPPPPHEKMLKQNAIRYTTLNMAPILDMYLFPI